MENNREFEEGTGGSEVRAEDYSDLEKRIINLLKEGGSENEVREVLLQYAEE